MSGAAFSFQWAENNVDAVTALVKQALRRGLYTAGEHILNVSNSRVPIEEGYLESTGTVSHYDEETVAISYDTPYAVRQHEDLSYSHDAGRSAKYLEIACKSEAKTAGRIVATAVKKVTGS